MQTYNRKWDFVDWPHESITEAVVTYNFFKDRHLHNFSWSSRNGKMEFDSNFNNMILKIAITSKLPPKSKHMFARKTKRVAGDLWLSLENGKFWKIYFGQKVILKDSIWKIRFWKMFAGKMDFLEKLYSIKRLFGKLDLVNFFSGEKSFDKMGIRKNVWIPAAR